MVVSDADISNVSDIEDDSTTVNATESTMYFESSISTIEYDDSVLAEKQLTH